MLLFSINRSRGYENPSLDIIVKRPVNIAFRFKVLFMLLFLYHFSVIVVNVLVILLLFYDY